MLRRSCRILTYLWLGFILLLILALRYVGENNTATAVLLYLPPSVWLLPTAPLLLAALLLRDGRNIFACIITLAFIASWLFGYELPSLLPQKTSPGDLTITILTHNIGERGNTSLQPFKNLIKPDLMTFQDAPSRGRRYKGTKGYEEFPYAEDVGEFTLVSRYPILNKQIILRPPTDVPEMMKFPLAARFEVDANGRRIVIYNVHAFSPREHLRPKAVIAAIVYGLAGWSGNPWEERRAKLQAFWSAQQVAMRSLTARIASETAPCILAGDTNTPPQGAIHRILTANLQDAHSTVGEGCGFTFPGLTRNPLSLFGPWLRIDRILASPHWRCVSTQVEPHNPSQHRALAATFSLPPISPH